MNINDELSKLNIEFPNAPDPVGAYVAAKTLGKILIISGQISMSKDGELIKGKLGKEFSTKEGYNAAHRCALSIVAQAKKACNGDLTKIKSCPTCIYILKSTYIGYKDFNKKIQVFNDEDIILDIFLDPTSVDIDETTVTAQRRQMKITDSPAAVEIIESTAISCYHVAPLTKLPREKYH